MTEEFMAAVEWIAERIPGGFFIYRADETQELLYVNRFVLRIFGCDTMDEFKTRPGIIFIAE